MPMWATRRLLIGPPCAGARFSAAGKETSSSRVRCDEDSSRYSRKLRRAPGEVALLERAGDVCFASSLDLVAVLAPALDQLERLRLRGADPLPPSPAMLAAMLLDCRCFAAREAARSRRGTACSLRPASVRRGPSRRRARRSIVWRDCGNGARVRGAARPARLTRRPTAGEITLAMRARPGCEAGRAHRRAVRESRRAGTSRRSTYLRAARRALSAGAARPLRPRRRRHARHRRQRTARLSRAHSTRYSALDPTRRRPTPGRRVRRREPRASPTSARARTERCFRSSARAESARDLERVRAALGEEKISYLGYSYGTALGATYATLFPERVRALVLDGAIDPSFDLAAVRARAGARASSRRSPRTTKRPRHRAGTESRVESSPRSPATRTSRAAGLACGAHERRAVRQRRGAADPAGGLAPTWRSRSAPRRPATDRRFVALSDRYFGRRTDGSQRARRRDTARDAVRRPAPARIGRRGLSRRAAGVRARLAALRPREPAFAPALRVLARARARARARRGADDATADPRPRQRPRSAHAARLGRAPGRATARLDAAQCRHARTPPSAAAAPASTRPWSRSCSRAMRVPRRRAVPRN